MIKKVATVEEGILRLFEAGKRDPVPFRFIRAGAADYYDTVEFDGKMFPVLKWRYHPKLNTIGDNLKNGTITRLGTPSTVKSLHFANRTAPLKKILFTEMDLAEFFVNSTVVSIMGYGCGMAGNFILRMKNGVMVNLETSVTLPEDAADEQKHTVYTTNGMISDRCVEQSVSSQQIYVFTDKKDPDTYTDHDINLFGLPLDDQNVCYACYALMTGLEDGEKWRDQAKHISFLADRAAEVLSTGKKYVCREKTF